MPNGVGTGRPPAKFLAAAHGMAIVAIADRRQFATSFDEGGIEGQQPGRLDGCNRRAPYDGKGGSRATKQHDGNDAGDNSGRSLHPRGKLPLRLLLLGRYFSTDHAPPFTHESSNCRRSALQGAPHGRARTGVSNLDWTCHDRW